MVKRIKELRAYNSSLNEKFSKNLNKWRNTEKQNDELRNVLLSLKNACKVVVECDLSPESHHSWGEPLEKFGAKSGESVSILDSTTYVPLPNSSMFFYINNNNNNKYDGFFVRFKP